jgi:hypothetical protein
MVVQSFISSIQIANPIPVLNGQKFARATAAGLNLIGHHQNSVLVGKRFKLGEKLRRRHNVSA